MILSVCPNPSVDCYAGLNMIEYGGTNRIEYLKEFPGGKAVHVGLAISELGMNTGLLGFWGGYTGAWIKEACSEKGLEVSGIELEDSSRKCYTFRSQNAEFSNTEILEPGPALTPQNWLDFKKLFQYKIEGASIICLSGSWPRKAPKDAYLQLLEVAQEKGKKVILDCSGNQLKEALKSTFFGLHLNEHEAFELCGSNDPIVLLNKLKNKVELIALTRGKEGLWMWYKGKIYIANVEIQEVVSTVGSGDCLTAGIAWALENNLNPEEIASFAVACGAANCINEDLGMLRREDVLNLLPKVICKLHTIE